MNSDNQVRLVVVGYGMGALHARLISEVYGLALHGVCDLSEAQRQRAQGDFNHIRTYGDFADVLNDPAVDGVVLVTPHNTHAPLAIAAMERGKHVVTDKPIALHERELCAMLAARDKSGVLLTAFQNRRWDSDFLTVENLVCSGAVGRVLHIQSSVSATDKPGGWRSDREAMGGWLYDWGAHTIDQILQLTGAAPEQVYAIAHSAKESDGQGQEVEDYVSCTIRFDDGTTAATSIGFLNPIAMPRWYVMGSQGVLQSDSFESPVRLRRLGDAGETSVPLVFGDWKHFYMNLDDALHNRAGLAVEPEQLIPQIRIIEAAYRSIDEARAIDL